MTKLHSLMFVQVSLDLNFELPTYPEPVEFELAKEVTPISDWLVWWRAEIERRLFFIGSWNKFDSSELGLIVICNSITEKINPPIRSDYSITPVW